MLKSFRKRIRLLRGDERGFTLVELLLVITIIGILAGVGVTGYANFQARANKAAADAAWRDLQIAINLHEADPDLGPFPASAAPEEGQDDTPAELALKKVLSPLPVPLQTDLQAQPLTDGNGVILPTANVSTGFYVGETGGQRFACVWMNRQPSQFNGEDCIKTE